MWFKGYHKSKLSWSYPEIESIDYFLEDFKEELTEINLEDNILLLETYRDELKTKPVILTLGICELEIQGLDEAVTVLRGLKSMH
ncbi:hypothetical protein [Senegalia massiliensis]|uniref:hypothetical protein n=1 Tax=Senegalia massiliensis TaxID=1720316 RepID=UPI00102FB9AD|nr:hypothetical protein [Senegalia massiliensis]